MKTSGPTAIRLTRTPEVAKSLALAKRRYPTLSDPEILKVALANLTVNTAEDDDIAEIRKIAAHSVGEDYLNDPAEDIYTLGMGKKVHFS
jgi:hypothetical protein